MMTLSNISSKARIWSGVFTELNSGFSDLQSGMQNSFRCLVAVNLCLAKRVNRDISAKYDLPPTTCHLPLPPATCHCHLPPTTCYHFSSLKKSAWQNKKCLAAVLPRCHIFCTPAWKAREAPLGCFSSPYRASLRWPGPLLGFIGDPAETLYWKQVSIQTIFSGGFGFCVIWKHKIILDL